MSMKTFYFYQKKGTFIEVDELNKSTHASILAEFCSFMSAQETSWYYGLSDHCASNIAEFILLDESY